MKKSAMTLLSKRKILNPLWVCYSISFLQKSIDSRDMVEEWGPFPMAFYMVSRDHSGKTSNGKLSEIYTSNRAIVGWPAAQGGALTVSCCADLS